MFEDILEPKKKQNIVEIYCIQCDYVIAWQLLKEGENKVEWPLVCPNCDESAEDVKIRSRQCLMTY